MRRHPLVFLPLFLIGALASPAQAQRRLPTLAEQQAHREAVARERPRRDLLRDLEFGRITLPEAARRAGGTLVLDRRPLDCFPQWDVRGLANRSSLVIVGRPFVARVALTDDRRSIVTTYSVQVEDTFKATSRVLPFVRVVIVTVPGGRMDFGDGTSAEIRSGPSLALGDRYVLFLQHERDAPSVFPTAPPGTGAALTAGAAYGAAVVYTPFRIDQGVFHLQADGRIRWHAHNASERPHREDGTPEAAFLDELKEAVAARRLCVACFLSHTVRFFLPNTIR